MTETTNRRRNAPDRKRLFLLGVAAILAVLVFAYRDLIWKPVFDGATLTAAQAHEQAVAGDILLVDIRRPDEWKRTGIGEGAHPLDMRRDDFTAALLALAGPDNRRPIALICARGVRSARLSQALTDAGITGILDVPEGMEGSVAGAGWVAGGLPVKPWTGASE